MMDTPGLPESTIPTPTSKPPCRSIDPESKHCARIPYAHTKNRTDAAPQRAARLTTQLRKAWMQELHPAVSKDCPYAEHDTMLPEVKATIPAVLIKCATELVTDLHVNGI